MRAVRQRVSIAATAGLLIVWIILWGSVAPTTIAVGLAVALGVQLAFPLPDVPEMRRLRPIALARLVAWIAWGLVRASVEVAVGVLSVHRPVRHALIRVPLASPSPFVHAMTVEVVTLIPGSIIVETREDELVLHVFDAASEASIERARREVGEAERLLVAAFASREERAAYRREHA